MVSRASTHTRPLYFEVGGAWAELYEEVHTIQVLALPIRTIVTFLNLPTDLPQRSRLSRLLAAGRGAGASRMRCVKAQPLRQKQSDLHSLFMPWRRAPCRHILPANDVASQALEPARFFSFPASWTKHYVVSSNPVAALVGHGPAQDHWIRSSPANYSSFHIVTAWKILKTSASAFPPSGSQRQGPPSLLSHDCSCPSGCGCVVAHGLLRPRSLFWACDL